MKSRRSLSWHLSVLLITAMELGVPALRAENTRTQTIALHQGWNAVFLQVSPTNRDPAAVFAGTPVEIAATYFAVEKPVQYIQNPGSTGWNKEGWAVWYGPGRPDAFLASLHAIHGNRAFLILATQDFTWSVTGTVAFEPMRWKGDSFNLRGLGVDELSPPTFDQYFATSTAHRPCRIYQLVNSQWTLVVDPVRAVIHAGEAYWIYCQGGSDYQGPLRVGVMAGQAIDFGAASEAWLTFANESPDPINLRVQTVAADVGLPLAYTIRGITQGAMLPVSAPLPASYSPPPIEPGDRTSFFLKLRRESMTAPVQSALLKITTDTGVELWIPATGARSDLTATR